MFVNLETTVLQAIINAEADSKWNAVVVRLLARYERNVAVGKIANAIQWDIYEREWPLDPLVSDLYRHGLKRVDFFTLALELIKSAEAKGYRALAEPSPMAA
jgi:hypothetical protein